MRIYIKAKAKSRKEYIKKIDDAHYIAAVKEPPVRGKANQAIIKSLSNYFHKPTSHIYIVNGETSRKKTIEIPITADKLIARRLRLSG